METDAVKIILSRAIPIMERYGHLECFNAAHAIGLAALSAARADEIAPQIPGRMFLRIMDDMEPEEYKSYELALRVIGLYMRTAGELRGRMIVELGMEDLQLMLKGL